LIEGYAATLLLKNPMFGSERKKIPDCDELFAKYMRPWYPDNEKPSGTRPDMYVIAAYDGKPLAMESLQYLNDECLKQMKEQIEKITDAALQDYQEIIRCEELDFRVLDAVDKHYDREKIKAIIATSDATDYANQYLVTVCEFGATIGNIFTQSDGFGWLYAHPYFHSIVVHKETGFGITVFDWAVKKFSEYGVDDGFVAKIHAAREAIGNHQSKR
jgi:hypothetical protein